MPIIRKTNLLRHVHDLEKHVEALKKALEGKEPNHGNWDQHAISESDYYRDFTHLDPHDLAEAVNMLRVKLKTIKGLEKHKEPRLHKTK